MDIYIEAKINGKSPGLKLNRMTIDSSVFNPCVIRLELNFQQKEAQNVYNKALDSWLGETLDVAVVDRVLAESKATYKGIITALDMKEFTIEIIAQSEDAMLGWVKRHRSFAEMDGNGVVKKLLESLKIKKIVPAGKSVFYKYAQQNNESDIEFLGRIARYDGALYYHDGDTFNYDTAMKGETLVTLTLDQISNISLNCHLGAVKAEGYPYNFAKHTEAVNFRTQSSPITPPAHALINKVYTKSKSFEALRELYHETVINKKEFEPLLGYTQGSEATNMARIIGETSLPTVKLGKSIQCSQMHLLSESVVIVGFRATFDGNEYHGYFEAVPKNSYLLPPVSDRFSDAGFPQDAVVMDNKDPDKLGRVQIQYKWKVGYGNDAQNPWARIVHTGAGKTQNGVQYGTHYIPRIGDHVLVACENGDISQPIILGALYHSETKPDVKTDNGTEEVLVVRTPRQSTVRVLDKEGEEEIVISMKDSKNLIRLELKQPKITIESIDGDILVHAKNISVNADETIAMNAKNITLKTKEDIKSTSEGNQKHSVKGNYTKEVAGNDEEKVQGNKKANVGGNHEDSASGNRKITGGANVEASAGAEMKVTGGVKASIQSAMVESSASATNTIKGAMVMIN